MSASLPSSGEKLHSEYYGEDRDYTVSVKPNRAWTGMRQ